MATRERVWLVDLMALRGGPGLTTVLPQLLRAPSVLKLGCSLSSDLTALVRMRSSAPCTSSPRPYLMSAARLMPTHKVYT